MGEARIGVWLANGAPGTQAGPRAPADWPRAGAAAGWGGDRLVSLVGRGIVGDRLADRLGQRRRRVAVRLAATDVLSGLTGAHAVQPVDVAGGLSAPVLVLVTSDPDTLAAAQAAFGVG